MIGKITYQYVPETWDQERFLRLGGMVAVFLNYNKKDFIEESVSSVLNQDFELIEVFLMDDASSDGSGDMMECLARKYRGPHKITVVRNDQNQHIIGQWKIVSKLATGYWLGMFCGDDVSFSYRTRSAAEIIKKYPTLLGFCTNYRKKLVCNGMVQDSDLSSDIKVKRGNDDVFDVFYLKRTPVIGATAWWHKSLFEYELPKVPLDDVCLRWILQLKRFCTSEVCWLWDGSQCTVNYSVGSGITSLGDDSSAIEKRYVDKWLAGTLSQRRFLGIQLKTLSELMKLELFSKGVNAVPFMSCLEFLSCRSLIQTSNTWQRLKLLPQVFHNGLIKVWCKYFFQELFGLKFAAWTSNFTHNWLKGR